MRWIQVIHDIANLFNQTSTDLPPLTTESGQETVYNHTFIFMIKKYLKKNLKFKFFFLTLN